MEGAKPNKGRIAVLAGGDSPEREISLASGACVKGALDAAGYSARVFDPGCSDLASIPWSEFDAGFIALHGGAGEDGRIQRRLELLKVPYTGSRPAACRLAMSKSASKERFLQAGVPTARYVLLQTDDPANKVAAKLDDLGYPLVIKPDSQGSSLGVSVAQDASQLEACLAACRPFDDFAIAEPLIRGREFTVAVIERRALPVLEIIPQGGLFDYAAKYTSEQTQYRFDSGLAASEVVRIEQLAVAAAACLGTSGLCRIDLMRDTQGRPWVLEVNTVPGMTDHSLAPKAARQGGIEMPRLCDLLIQQCLTTEVML